MDTSLSPSIREDVVETRYCPFQPECVAINDFHIHGYSTPKGIHQSSAADIRLVEITWLPISNVHFRPLQYRRD